MFDTLGWIGSIMLAICGLPQAVQSLQNKNSAGISGGFLALWFLGELFTWIYIFPKADLPLLVNYSLNICFLCVIIWYKLFPRTYNLCFSAWLKTVNFWR